MAFTRQAFDQPQDHLALIPNQFRHTIGQARPEKLELDRRGAAVRRIVLEMPPSLGGIVFTAQMIEVALCVSGSA